GASAGCDLSALARRRRGRLGVALGPPRLAPPSLALRSAWQTARPGPPPPRKWRFQCIIERRSCPRTGVKKAPQPGDNQRDGGAPGITCRPAGRAVMRALAWGRGGRHGPRRDPRTGVPPRTVRSHGLIETRVRQQTSRNGGMGRAGRWTVAATTLVLLAASVAAPAATQAANLQVVSGRYIGNGATSRPVTGLGFKPDLVIIKARNAAPPVVR